MTATLAPPPDAAAGHRPPPQSGGPTERGRVARFLRGSAADPQWARPALFGLLVATAALYLWNLSASGYANSFYAAAAQAGSQSWKAWFFGSLDSGNSITVDKPPAALWLMGLSARVFGVSSWSILVPQALEGVAAVGLLYGAVRRVAGHGAGLLAGAVLALTPAAVLMFRFDNPDALLTLLLVAAAYAVTRSLETASTRWLALAGSALGFAFLTKMLQGLLVLPAFALVYLIAAPTGLGRRIRDVLLASVALVVSAGWWVAIVQLWPASSRPYIGGSTDNSVLDLVVGYNGFGRLFGGDGNGGSGGGSTGAAGSSFGGATGLDRLFSSEMGNEISWLLPAALVAIVAGLALTRRAARTDPLRASVITWGGWLIVTGLVFSYMKGTVHPYYTVALAPAVGALVAIVGAALWQRRAETGARVGLAAIIAAGGGWSAVLLGRTSSWHPELRWIVLAATLLAVVGVLVPAALRSSARRGVVVVALVGGLLGAGSFAVATAATTHTGSIPSVGPAAAQTGGVGGGGGMGGGAMGGGTRTGAGGPPGATSGSTGSTSTGSGSGSTSTAGRPSLPSGASGTASTGSAPTGSATTSGTTGSATGTTAQAGTGGGATTSSALAAALKATSGTWAAAVSGSQSAAELELATGKAVIAIGGWSGTDDSPTLAQFQAWVQAGRIGYYISSGSGGGAGGSSSGSAAQIATWVAAHYTATTLGGSTVYELTS